MPWTGKCYPGESSNTASHFIFRDTNLQLDLCASKGVTFFAFQTKFFEIALNS